MGKRNIIDELTTRLAIALRHKIGSIVNENEIYAQKYSKDAEVLINQCKPLVLKKNWNLQDKQEIKRQLRLKLEKELKERDFIDNKKFEIMNQEIEKALEEIELI
jgi:NAD dependent epimerase/dehydratase family enzyme